MALETQMFGVSSSFPPMARVYPSVSISLHQQPSSEQACSEREIFTVWMKSLVLHGKGCTIFDSNGQIAYRVDNYSHKGRGEVNLMDHSGKVLFMILKKNLGWFGRWEGHRCTGSQDEVMRPYFKVKMPCRILKVEGSTCEVFDDTGHLICYIIHGLSSKPSYKIVDISRKLVAEVSRKQTASGVVLGDDVLTLIVEPHIDHSIIMGIVVVYGLMHHSL